MASCFSISFCRSAFSSSSIFLMASEARVIGKLRSSES